MTDALVQFLRDRLDEDAAAVRRHWNRDGVTSERFHSTPLDPARALAEVDAKQQIVELHAPLNVEGDPITGCTTCSWRDEMDELWVQWPCPTLRLLALPCSSHPDYRPEWRP